MKNIRERYRKIYVNDNEDAVILQACALEKTTVSEKGRELFLAWAGKNSKSKKDLDEGTSWSSCRAPFAFPNRASFQMQLGVKPRSYHPRK